jgi:hypothetical protein
VQQIADWLKKLGFSEYAQRFVENDIDVSVLPHLTDQDLKELGVSLGHRRKMLAANLAARLQGVAEPDMVVLAEGTRRLLGNLFELQDLGARELKGIARSVRIWAALRASSVESRFEALHASTLTALVGREEESELLLRAAPDVARKDVSRLRCSCDG